jgi:hypothetical protein
MSGSIVSSLIGSLVQAAPYIIDGATTSGDPCHGSVGHKQFADNARILFINGVGSREEHCREKASLISDIFDHCKVDYVYVPLTFSSACTSLQNRSRPRGGQIVLDTINRMNAEIRGLVPPANIPLTHKILEGGERIICIVHSGGGATFRSIADSIPPAVRERIDLISFGSANLFRTGTFRSVRNIVASNDPIPLVGSLITHDARGLLDRGTILTPTQLGENSIQSHQFMSATYRTTLHSLRWEYEDERKEEKKL